MDNYEKDQQLVSGRMHRASAESKARGKKKKTRKKDRSSSGAEEQSSAASVGHAPSDKVGPTPGAPSEVHDQAEAAVPVSTAPLPAMAKRRAYELAMTQEETRMDAAVAKQAEEDSRKRRTKKRLEAMAKTARLHAAAKETRAITLGSEADGLQQRAAALERLEQRAQNRSVGRATQKAKRARKSPSVARVTSMMIALRTQGRALPHPQQHQQQERYDTLFGTTCLIVVQTHFTCLFDCQGNTHVASFERIATTTATNSQSVQRDECVRRGHGESRPASAVHGTDVNVVPAEELTADGYTALDSGNEDADGVEIFDSSDELCCDDPDATFDESCKDDDLGEDFEASDNGGTARRIWGENMNW
ncbi:unnamed protein product [Phytophthora fragariaefolia]|uniref:Unnamed protein product n=1 Tax=Phytophthora fragariaefolia TaxID=1490495 RepID=A0A9W7D2T1_9STRA|nr:unnamed protein product [Phytophthora fragariaefolia]